MTLVPHIDGYRRIWQFPRNIRRIYPWKMGQILLLLSKTGATDWANNQQAQDEFCKALEKQGLKREGFQRDVQSGGPRTYLAQLKAMGLIFRANNGLLYPTLAGEDLITGASGLEVMQTMLMRHQYPSIYAMGNNVRINPYLRVKPFMFILQILCQVGSLNIEELAVPVVYGHNHQCLDICITKIGEIRSGKSLESIIDNFDLDLYLPRSRESSLVLKTNNIRDIANTCKNYMDSCFLVNTEIGDDGRQHIFFNEEIRGLYESELEHLDQFLPVYSEEQFQRRYGAWNKSKDTRNLLRESPEIEANKVANNIILAEYLALCGQKMITDIPDDFVEGLHAKWGFDRQVIAETIGPYVVKSLDKFSTTFLELARGGQSNALAFEKVLCDLLQDKLLFKVEHTGQRKRPAGRMGGYADGFIVSLDGKHCGLVDAKASPGYRLTHDDYNAMLHTYIPNYTEIAGSGLVLEFCLYVAYGFAGNIDANLKRMTAEANDLPVSAIKAGDLLSIAKDFSEPSQQQSIRTGFKKAGLLSLHDFNM